MLGRLKEILKASSKSLMFTYFIIIMIILLPNAIVMPSQSFKSQIITAIGIDGKVDDIEMSVLALSNLSKDNMSGGVGKKFKNGACWLHSFVKIINR